ncbi:MAG: hypothetical protein FJW38_08120 [Acidobacteria bacterium]|nr:hypothetical protein [Acidobacteriota bacterium]
MNLAHSAVVVTALLLTGCGCNDPTSPFYDALLRDMKKGLPVSYEYNLGQADNRFQYVARTPGMTLYLTPAEAVLDVRDFLGHEGSVLRAELFGANPMAVANRGKAPETMANFFIGSDSSKWLTDVPVFSSVRSTAIYPGIDVEYRGENGILEHDFIVAPNADPSAIRMNFKGADGVRLDRDGNLEISIGRKKISWRKPVLYQDVEHGRLQVEGAYRLDASGQAAFSVGTYDKSKTLVIDPVVQYLTYVGRSGLDAVTRVATDSNGNVYMTGFTQDSNFPSTPGAYQVNSAGASTGNVIVAKLNAAGTAATYITQFGGATIDFGVGIAVDSAGNVYLAGGTDSANFPTTSGALKTTFTSQNPAASHCFVTKLNAAGNALAYSTYLGGNSTDRCYAVAADNAGSAYVTGRTSSTNFPVTESAPQSAYRGGAPQTNMAGSPIGVAGSDVFVAKLNPTGSSIVYATYVGGSGNEVATAIAVDGQGAAYVGGVTNSVNFPVTQGAFQTAYGGAQGQTDFNVGDAFVLKLNPAGTSLVYNTLLGGRQNEVLFGIAVDSQGSAYVTGSTASSNFPTTARAAQRNYGGAGGEARIVAGDGFVSKLAPNGQSLVFSTFLGGARDERATALALDTAGNVWVTGHTLSTDFPTTNDAFQRTLAGQPGNDIFIIGDAFVTQIDAAGSAILTSSYLGGRGGDAGTSILVLPDNSVVVAGLTSSTDLPVTSGAYQRQYFGVGYTGVPVGDGFVAKLGQGQSTISVAGIASAASYAGGAVAPGEIVILAGTGIGPSALTTAALNAQGEISRTLADTRIRFDDTPAPLIYASAGQSSAVVPYNVAGKQSVRVVVEQGSNRSAPITVPVVAAKPALFSANSSGRGPGAILNQDTSFNSASNPAAKGSVIVLFGTGEGATDPPGADGRLATSVFPKPSLPVSVTIGDTRVTQLSYAGAAPGLVAGVFQINVVIPPDAPSGDVPVTVTVGSFTSQTGLTVAIR